MSWQTWKSQGIAFTILLATTIFICVQIALKQPVVDVLSSQQFRWSNFGYDNNFTNHLYAPKKPSIMPKKPRTDYDYAYTVSYDNWIRGIGDNYLWNNESNSTCLYPRVPYKMNEAQAINRDILFHHKHYCESAQSFSEIFDRVITAHCPSSATLQIAEFDDIYHGEPPVFNSTDWKLIPQNQSVGSIMRGRNNQLQQLLVYTIELQETSQTSWVWCENQHQYHFALLPLKQRNETLYKEKSENIKRNFNNAVPPNVVVFIIDSTARANFFRGASSTIQYLSNLQLDRESKVKTDVLQFFRYSTVGWGTGQNLLGLAGGGCTLCRKHPFAQNCTGLAEYYDSLGYESLGYTYYINNREGNRFPWQSGAMGADNNCDFYLSQNVLPKPCKHGNDVRWAKDYALQSIALQRNMDQDVPYFVILHSQANHVTSGNLIFQYDAWVRELVEYIDKDNTILHIVGDHGSLVGASLANIFGTWEMMNPVSILMLPQWLDKRLHFLDVMRVNEQRFTNHYDMHYFFKQLLVKLLKEPMQEEMAQKVEESLPISDADRAMSYSLMDTEIPVDRDCDQINLQFCFCEVLQEIELTNSVRRRDAKYVDTIVDTINEVTGNGEWHCEVLKAREFVIEIHLENKENDYMQIVIEKFVDDVEERERLITDNRLLSFTATFRKQHSDEYKLGEIKRDGKPMPSISRLDYFKYEECLITSYQRDNFRSYDPYFAQRTGFGTDLEPIFEDYNMTTTMLTYTNKTQRHWNLRVCHCKV
eukprot:53336_1